MKIRPSGAYLLYADGQTDMTKVIVIFRNFANALKTVFQDAVVVSHLKAFINLDEL
jgi:hypothetical protein